jgi:hypothetical protein
MQVLSLFNAPRRPALRGDEKGSCTALAIGVLRLPALMRGSAKAVAARVVRLDAGVCQIGIAAWQGRVIQMSKGTVLTECRTALRYLGTEQRF